MQHHSHIGNGVFYFFVYLYIVHTPFLLFKMVLHHIISCSCTTILMHILITIQDYIFIIENINKGYQK